MFNIFDKAIIGMATLRLLSGSIEIFAAILILKFNQVDKALIINSSLAVVGPLVLILTTTIGLIGIAGEVSYKKLIWIVVGVASILYGVKNG